MPQLDHAIRGDLDAFLAYLDRQLPAGSFSTRLSASSDRRLHEARMAVRVYERYTPIGRSRVALTIAILAIGRHLEISVVTAGGAAVFPVFKPLGTRTFLAHADRVIRRYQAQTTGG